MKARTYNHRHRTTENRVVSQIKHNVTALDKLLGEMQGVQQQALYLKLVKRLELQLLTPTEAHKYITKHITLISDGERDYYFRDFVDSENMGELVLYHKKQIDYKILESKLNADAD